MMDSGRFALLEEADGAVLAHHGCEEVERVVPVAARHAAHLQALAVDVPLHPAVYRVAHYLEQVLLGLDERQHLLPPLAVYAQVAPPVPQVAPVGQRAVLVDVAVHPLALALLRRQPESHLVVVLAVADHLQADHPHAQRDLLGRHHLQAGLGPVQPADAAAAEGEVPDVLVIEVDVHSQVLHVAGVELRLQRLLRLVQRHHPQRLHLPRVQFLQLGEHLVNADALAWLGRQHPRNQRLQVRVSDRSHEAERRKQLPRQAWLFLSCQALERPDASRKVHFDEDNAQGPNVRGQSGSS